jgi:hypothetical protein
VTIDGVWIGEWISWPLGTTSNYSAIANLHNSQITTAPAKLFPACYVFNSCFLATALTVEIIQLHALTSLLSGEYPANELLSTQLQRHLFSASLAELDLTANPQLNSLIHHPTRTSLHFTSLDWNARSRPGSSLCSLGANIAFNCPIVVMGGCLTIDWISFPRERVYRQLPSNARFFSRSLHSNGTTRCSVVLYVLLGCSLLTFYECRISLVVQFCKAYLWSQASYLGVSLVCTQFFTAVAQILFRSNFPYSSFCLCCYIFPKVTFSFILFWVMYLAIKRISVLKLIKL